MAANDASSQPGAVADSAGPPALAGAACPKASAIPGVGPDDPLQRGIDLAMQAVWLFLDSDFEKVETLLHTKRHHLLYASEGYAGIQYMRGTMAFTQEAMACAQQAAESTINLAMHYRKPRGVGSMLSRPASRTVSRSSSPQAGAAASNSGSPGAESGAAAETSAAGEKARRRGEYGSWLRMSSPLQRLREKKQRQGAAAGDDLDPGPTAYPSDESLPSERAEFDPALLDAKYSDLQALDRTDNGDGSNGGDQILDAPQQRSWASGIASMADSVIDVVRSGTQAIGISRPEWHALKAMTPTQQHAELVHAEAYLLRAMLNIGMGDGVLALLREGWHVRSAYATYRSCNAFIQDAHAGGERVDDHFVSGTYLGMGVFNLVLSMLPAKLLRFVELVGFSADRRLGLELLAVAAGWRTDPLTAGLIGPPPPASARVHPCDYGLRSEFCALVLLSYHIVLCNDLFLGYPNLPLADAVLRRSRRQHPNSLIFIFFEGRFLAVRSRLDEAIARFGEIVQRGRGAPGSALPDRDATPAALAEALISELAALKVDDAAPEDAPSTPLARPPADGESDDAAGGSDWRQLQYLGYWERSLCLMSLGRWLEAAEGFNVLRKENNWNKAVYAYSLACCLWEHYLELCGGTAPLETAEQPAEQARVLATVHSLMALVPTLRRKVAGKSIPIEKFVTRKAGKFLKQGGFLMRPGLELLHTWNLYSKMPRERLLALRGEVDREIERMAQFAPIIRAPPNPHRHIYYYDDLAVLLLTKGCILRELARPSFASTLAEAGSPQAIADNSSQPELGSVAVDTLLRLLRLMPMIWRDHYLPVMGRFHLGSLYLAEHGTAGEWMERARMQWRCVLGGQPLSSPPFLSLEEFQAHAQAMRSLHINDSKAAAAPMAAGELLAAPGCQTEEKMLQDTGHPSLTFYDGTWLMSEWRHLPPDWSDSRRYSLENMLEVRVFNADNRLQEKLDAVHATAAAAAGDAGRTL
ncbi:hypothetical protein LPJ61_000580 [Coemansia biformis]|uniref:Uncharacterized protein n=1 Tax=Coemansia biformis TaxID=1286918 RepID=A0A9W8D0X5_9FUNG|nr:hypothetical protein LPJ61_000580 [Coemansia biformis]